MKRYNKEDAKCGMIVGNYDAETDYTYWDYLLVGCKDESKVTVMNLKTGHIGKVYTSNLYIPSPPKNGYYLDYDQEGMQTGETVYLRNSQISFTITKIQPAKMTCNLKCDYYEKEIEEVPLSYLHYNSVTKEGKVIKRKTEKE